MLGRTLMIATGIAGAVAASQAPEFAQQYRQRLGGAIDEITRSLSRFDADAEAAGYTPDAALYRLVTSADPVAQARGAAIGDDMDRLARLSAQRAAFTNAAPLERITILAENVDPTIAQATWRDFEPAVPTTAEGAMIAGAGFLAGGSVCALLVGLLKMTFLSRPKPRPRGRARA